jgi:CheY-like chemotaxis protein
MAASENSALVVDDHYHNRDLFRIALENAGYTVTEARNGEEAITILEKETFRLLILDLHMPIMDGTQVLKWVRANSTHDAMRVIVATANAQMVLEDVNAQADYVIYKPLEIRDFIQLVKRLRADAQPNP